MEVTLIGMAMGWGASKANLAGGSLKSRGFSESQEYGDQVSDSSDPSAFTGTGWTPAPSRAGLVDAGIDR